MFKSQGIECLVMFKKIHVINIEQEIKHNTFMDNCSWSGMPRKDLSGIVLTTFM